jgi:hypothetical protein
MQKEKNSKIKKKNVKGQMKIKQENTKGKCGKGDVERKMKKEREKK